MQSVTMNAESIRMLVIWCLIAIAMGAFGGWIDGTPGKVVTALAVVPALILASLFVALGMPQKGWLIYNLPGLLAIAAYFTVSRVTA